MESLSTNATESAQRDWRQARHANYTNLMHIRQNRNQEKLHVNSVRKMVFRARNAADIATISVVLGGIDVTLRRELPKVGLRLTTSIFVESIDTAVGILRLQISTTIELLQLISISCGECGLLMEGAPGTLGILGRQLTVHVGISACARCASATPEH